MVWFEAPLGNYPPIADAAAEQWGKYRAILDRIGKFLDHFEKPDDLTVIDLCKMIIEKTGEPMVILERELNQEYFEFDFEWNGVQEVKIYNSDSWGFRVVAEVRIEDEALISQLVDTDSRVSQHVMGRWRQGFVGSLRPKFWSDDADFTSVPRVLTISDYGSFRSAEIFMERFGPDELIRMEENLYNLIAGYDHRGWEKLP